MSKVLYFSLLIVLSASASLSRFEDVLLMAKKSGDMSKYLKPTKNCQVSDKSIQSKAKSLSSGSEREKAEKIFHFVQRQIPYERYSNSRYGAEKKKKRGKGNCCDQAHLLVALFRAAGLPARYLHGNDHWWTDVYVGGKWYPCDPTNQRHQFGKPDHKGKQPKNPSIHISLDH